MSISTERGIAAPEYAIILSLMLCLCLPITAQLGGTVDNTFHSVNSDQQSRLMAIFQSSGSPDSGRPFGESEVTLGGGSETTGPTGTTTGPCEDGTDDCMPDTEFGSRGASEETETVSGNLSSAGGESSIPAQVSGLW